MTQGAQRRRDAMRETLIRAAYAGRRTMTREWIGAACVASLLWITGVVMLVTHGDVASMCFAAVLMSGPSAVLLYFAWSQRDAWHAWSPSTEDLLMLEVDRRDDVVRRMRLVCGLEPAVLVVALVRERLTPPGEPTLGGVLTCVLMLCLSWRADMRCARAKRERKQLVEAWERMKLDAWLEMGNPHPDDDSEDPALDAKIERLAVTFAARHAQMRRRWRVQRILSPICRIGRRVVRIVPRVAVVGAVVRLTYALGAVPPGVWRWRGH
jgi:hypothetical protein